MTKLLIIIAIAVGFVIYTNIGWLILWACDNPEKTGIFESFFYGPKWFPPADEDKSNFFTRLIWPILFVFILFVWLIQIIAWLCKAIVWMGKMTFGGGIAKKIVGEE